MIVMCRQILHVLRMHSHSRPVTHSVCTPQCHLVICGDSPFTDKADLQELAQGELP